MRWLRIGLLAWFSLPAAALGQDVQVTTLVESEETNAMTQLDGPPPPPSSVIPVRAETAPDYEETPETGWALVGGQLGLGLALAGFGALSTALDEPAVMGASILPALGLGAAGGAWFGSLAEQGEWDAGWGWALASLFPGAFYGLLAGTLAVLVSDDVAEEAGMVLPLATAAGALAVAPLFAVLGNEGRAALSFGTLWGGMLAGLLIGLPFALACEDPTPAIVVGLTLGAFDTLLSVILSDQ